MTHSLAAYSCQGLYINLERSTERRQCLESHLSQRGLLPFFSRLIGIDGNDFSPGHFSLRNNEAGAYLSHVKAWQNYDHQSSLLHVIEDDAHLAVDTTKIMTQLYRQGVFNEFDILLGDIYLDFSVISDCLKLVKSYRENKPKSAFSVLELKDFLFYAGMVSYWVSPRALPRLLQLAQDDIAQGFPNKLPIDLKLRQWIRQGLLRVGVIVPFISYPRLSLDTTIQKHRFSSDFFHTDYRDRCRQALFVDTTAEELEASLAPYRNPLLGSDLMQLMTHMLSSEPAEVYNWHDSAHSVDAQTRQLAVLLATVFFCFNMASSPYRAA